jgi:hypothetical protein
MVMAKEVQYKTMLGQEGLLDIYGDGINTEMSREAAALRSEKLNQPEKLRAILNDQERLYTGQVGVLRFSVIRPTSPYTPGSLMFAAHTEDYNGLSEKPQYIYEFGEVEQRAYWAHILAGLFAHGNQSFYTENTTQTTSFEHRSSRTLNFIHGQFGSIKEEWLQPHGESLEHLGAESRKTLSLMDRINGPLGAIMNDVRASSPSVELEYYARPTGYALSFPLTADLPELIATVQRTMEAHWQAYSNYVKDEEAKVKRASENNSGIEKRDIIPGPSYRQYVWFEDGMLKILISPEYDSHAGVMEGMGIHLRRTLSGKTYISPEDEMRQKETFARQYHATMEILLPA